GGAVWAGVGAPPTRRYHGVLIAALPGTLGRMMMLSQLVERVHLDDGSIISFGFEDADSHSPSVCAHCLSEFELEEGLPVWRFNIAGPTLERRVFPLALQNTSYETYQLMSGKEPIQQSIRPLVHCRSHVHPGGRRTP